MAVKIDMDMPKSCWDCKFCEEIGNTNELYCFLNRIVFDENYDIKIRQSWCPLKECK